MNFKECVVECAGIPEFVDNFNRLTGHTLGTSTSRKPIDIIIDKATGHDKEVESKEKENMMAFTAFVYECIWSRLPREIQT